MFSVVNVRTEVSFEGVEMVIVAFLNVAVGQLYGVFSEEAIDRVLSYTHLPAYDERMLKLVVAYAVRNFSKQKVLDETTDESQ